MIRRRRRKKRKTKDAFVPAQVLCLLSSLPSVWLSFSLFLLPFKQPRRNVGESGHAATKTPTRTCFVPPRLLGGVAGPGALLVLLLRRGSRCVCACVEASTSEPRPCSCASNAACLASCSVTLWRLSRSAWFDIWLSKLECVDASSFDSYWWWWISMFYFEITELLFFVNFIRVLVQCFLAPWWSDVL